MKSLIFILTICFLFLTGCRTLKPAVMAEPVNTTASGAATESAPVNYSDQSTWLLGYFSTRQLRSEPHAAWFFKGFDEYQPGQEALASLKTLGTDGITIKIVMGTWCPDSRREVPRFMKILDLWQFPSGAVTFIGVDNSKLSPVGEYEQLDIHRVPTFIIFKNNIEAGRIIENPVTSLEQDMVNILRGMNNNK